MKDRIGEISYTKDGKRMTIIDYESIDNISVQLDDGRVLSGLSYASFRSGIIRGIKVGEESINIKGLKMKIIAYHSCNNIDIEFEDGTIKRGISYSVFKSGKVNRGYAVERVGETIVNNRGMSVKIIEYRSCDDIDVEFEDGTINQGVSYDAFKHGRVCKPINRVGEINTNKNGLLMEIIAYHSSSNIDIKFEDGTIRYGVDYSNFKSGNVSKITNRKRGK